MQTSRVLVPTAHASRTLQQLCKHWAHKFDVTATPEAGRIALPLGSVTLAADPVRLTVAVSAANANDLATMRQVVQSHIERFAFRESLIFAWSDEDENADRGPESASP